MTMSESPGATGRVPARAVVAAHADLAAAFVTAVARIAGDDAAARLVPVSNAGLGAPELLDAVRASVLSSGASVVFTDLPAGSCTVAARRVAHEVPGLDVVCGANLPMLLAFALGTVEARALVRLAAEKGRAGVQVAVEGTRGA
jgi:mannose/fructose-specific phosphotransferase system component IIA